METRNKKMSEALPVEISILTKEQLRMCILYDCRCGLNATASLKKKKLHLVVKLYPSQLWPSGFPNFKMEIFLTDNPHEGHQQTVTHEENVMAVKVAIDEDG